MDSMSTPEGHESACKSPERPEPVKKSQPKPCAENSDPQLRATATPETIDRVAGSSSNHLNRRRVPDVDSRGEHGWPQPAVARQQEPWDAPRAVSKVQKTCAGSEPAGFSLQQAASALSAQSDRDQETKAIGRQNRSGSSPGGTCLVGIEQREEIRGEAGQQGVVYGSSWAPGPCLSNGGNTTPAGTGDQPTPDEMALASRHVQQTAEAKSLSWVQTGVRPGGAAGQDAAREACCAPRRDMVDLPVTYGTFASNAYSNSDLPLLPGGISNTSSTTSNSTSSNTYSHSSNTYSHSDQPRQPLHPTMRSKPNGGAPREQHPHEQPIGGAPREQHPREQPQRQEIGRGKEWSVAQEPQGAGGGWGGGGGAGGGRSGLGEGGAAAWDESAAGHASSSREDAGMRRSHAARGEQAARAASRASLEPRASCASSEQAGGRRSQAAPSQAVPGSWKRPRPTREAAGGAMGVGASGEWNAKIQDVFFQLMEAQPSGDFAHDKSLTMQLYGVTQEGLSVLVRAGVGCRG